MKISKLFIQKITLIALLFALVGASYGVMNVAYSRDETSSMFEAYNNSKDIVINDNAKAEFTSDQDSGALITSFNENSMAQVSKSIYGDFEMSFRFNPNNKGTGAQFERKIDFKTLDIFFVDATDESNYFSVNIAGDSYWGSNYLKAMVCYKTFKGGVNQDSGGAIIAPGTTINGSFEASSPYDKRTIIVYDNDKQQVLGSTYAGNTDNPYMTVIADLDNPKHVKEDVFTGFENGYKVRIRMSGLIEPKNTQRPAKMVVYTLNNQNVSAPIVNNIGANTFTKFISDGVINKKYLLPTAYTYDIIDGVSEFNSNAKNQITIIDPLEVSTACKLGYFTPTTPGIYTIEYTAVDASDAPGNKKTYKLNVLQDAPPINISLTDKNRKTVAKDKEFYLSSATATSELSLLKNNAISCNVVVKNGNTIVYDEQNAINKTKVSFTEYGEYVVSYIAKDYIGNTKQINESIICQNEPNISFAEFNENLFVNKKFDIPNVSATFNGKDYAVKTIIVDPYGQEKVITEKSYTPLFNGLYKLKFVSEYETKNVTEEVALNVGISPSDMFMSIKNVELEPNVSAPIYSMPANGVKITGYGEGATAKFSNIIDISEVTKETPFLEFQITPKQAGKLEFKKLFVYITDISDPTSKITLEFITSQWDNRWAYVKAGADKNRLLGIWQDGMVDEEGNYPILDNFNGGTQLRNSFAGIPYMDTRAKLFKIYYDNAEKAIYADDHLGIKQMVIDLDDSRMVGGGKEWKGFASNQVEVSFKFAETVGSSSSLLVSSIANQKLSSASVVDIAPPSIIVDTDDILPLAQVNKQYKLPLAIAYDIIDGKIEEIKIECFDKNNNVVEIDNGIITPSVRGKYKLVYSCSDRSGNEKSIVYEIDCREKVDEISLVFDRELVNTAYVGQTIFIPDVTITGGSKIISATRYLILDNKGLAILPNNTFVPLKAGKYRALHMVEDYIGNQKEFNNYIDVTVCGAPIVNFPTIAETMINGATYILPSFEAIDYNYNKDDSKYKAKTTISYEYKGVTKEIIDNKFTPIVDNAGDIITIIYSASNASGETKKEYPITIAKPKTISDYFNKNGVDTSLYSDSIGFNAKNNGAEFSFINPIPSKYIEITFEVKKDNNNFDFFDVWFTDAQNSENSFFVRIYKRDSNGDIFYKTSYASINGKGLKIEIPGSFYDNSNSLFKLNFDARTGLITAYGGSEIGYVTQNYDGKMLEKFSDTAYVSARFGNVSGNAELRLIKLMNQSFFGEAGKDFTDTTPPILNINGKFNSSARLNDVITLYSASAIDVIDPNVTVVVTVQAPNKKLIINKESISQERSLKLDQYGIYRISYEARDSSGRKFVSSSLIRVEDSTPPTINIKKLDSVYKLGDKIIIGNCEVIDNNDSSVKFNIYIKTPYGMLVSVKNGEYTPTAVGKYSLIVFAKDSDYNYEIDRQEFFVQEGK